MRPVEAGLRPPPELPLADFRHLPPIYVLPTHLTPEKLQEVEGQLADLHAPLTRDITEAKLILGIVRTKRRIELELRARRLYTTQATSRFESSASSQRRTSPARKKPKTSEILVQGSSIPDDSSTDPGADGSSTTESEAEGEDGSPTVQPSKESDHRSHEDALKGPISAANPGAIKHATTDNLIRLIDLEWLHESAKAARVLPFSNYTVYVGEVVSSPKPTVPATQPEPVHHASPTAPEPASLLSQTLPVDQPEAGRGILERAKADVANASPHHLSRFLDARPTRQKTQHAPHGSFCQTTSRDDDSGGDIPEPPDWVRRRLKYACQRPTPKNSPNSSFLEELKKVRLSRILTLDEIGVRAYSTSIAAVAAYPHPLTSTKEILSLPGCESKIARLWMEWKSNGRLQAVADFEDDPELQTIRQFYDIWGVGATTAREFYDRGWRDLDDVVEYGWDRLTRVQQIGLKYYEEFQSRVPRSEVESIAATVYEHAVRARDQGIECILVGSYRRGSEDSGDVDVILSHRDLDATNGLVTDIVTSLESENWITHTLILELSNTQRGQSTLPFRSHGRAGHGFDTLDKALVVWQTPSQPSSGEEAQDPGARNLSLHRRVDIIVSPWRTVGCAILGWSGDTTFERDLRRYARVVHNWKFDSSGIRDRTTGQVVPIEGPNGVDGRLEDAERRVFEGLGLEYRHPMERWTR